MTLHDRLCDALRTLGYQEAPGKSGRYTVFARAIGFYYVGKAGALRTGKTVAGSLSISDVGKMALVEKARAAKEKQ